MENKNLKKKLACTLLGSLMALNAPFSWSQSANLNGSIPVLGEVSFGPVDDAPPMIQLPSILVDLANNLLEKTRQTGNEHGTCLRRRPRAVEWTFEEIVEGTPTQIGLDCYLIEGKIHTHPNDSNYAPEPSGRDLALFSDNRNHASIVVHDSGICALVYGAPKRQLKSISDSMFMVMVNDARNSIAAVSRVRSPDAVRALSRATAAKSAKEYGFPLYCGSLSGQLSKVAAGNQNTELTDVLMAKALIIMLKIARFPEWDPINFKFTPEIDDDFLKYVNKIIVTDPKAGPSPFLFEKTPSDSFVKRLYEHFGRHESVDVEYFVNVPHPGRIPKLTEFLRFACNEQSAAPGKTVCFIRSRLLDKNGEDSGSSNRVFARYEEGGSHFIIEYPELKNNAYRSNDPDVRGVGYYEEDTSLYVGTFRNTQRHGEGDLVLKENGKKYRAAFSQGKLLAAKPIP